MAAVADRIVPGGTVDDAVAALDADPARTIPGKDNFRDWMQDLADQTIERDGRRPLRHPRADPPDRVLHRADQRRRHLLHRAQRGLEPARARCGGRCPTASPTSRPGARSRPSTTRASPAITSKSPRRRTSKDLLNRWQRTMCWVSGHGEGWALYAERLMDDLGYLDDPGNKLGMLDGQALRAVRVIIDIGMHLELEIPADNPFGFHPGETWTPDLGLEFMRQHVPAR